MHIASSSSPVANTSFFRVQAAVRARSCEEKIVKCLEPAISNRSLLSWPPTSHPIKNMYHPLSLFVTHGLQLISSFVNSMHKRFEFRAFSKTWSWLFTPHVSLRSACLTVPHSVQRVQFSAVNRNIATLIVVSAFCWLSVHAWIARKCSVQSCIHHHFGPRMCWQGYFLSNALSSFRFCNENSPCPLPIFWSSWGPWNKCSVNCGGGIHSRQRSCENGNTCPGCAVVCIVYWHCIRGTCWHLASRNLVFNSSLHLGFISQARGKCYLQLLLERMLKWTGRQRGGRFPKSVKLVWESVCLCVYRWGQTGVRRTSLGLYRLR